MKNAEAINDDNEKYHIPTKIKNKVKYFTFHAVIVRGLKFLITWLKCIDVTLPFWLF